MADLVLVSGTVARIAQPEPPVFAIERPASPVQVVVPVRGLPGVNGEAAEGDVDPVALYLSTRAQEA